MMIRSAAVTQWSEQLDKIRQPFQIYQHVCHMCMCFPGEHCSAFIGPSLSEPHTSVTALTMCVCMCMLVWTDHLLEISKKHSNVSRRSISCAGREQLSESSATRREDDWSWSMQVACVLVMMLNLLQLRSRGSAHDFLSPCMYNLSSCPDSHKPWCYIYVLCGMTICAACSGSSHDAEPCL